MLLFSVCSERKEVISMLEDFFVKPETIVRLRGSWIGPQIEEYVAWLVERGFREAYS